MSVSAAIDIGSNSLLLTVVDDEGRVLHDEAVVVGLGKGLGDGGRFRPDRAAFALALLHRYAERAAALGVRPEDVLVCATSGARRASDATEFFAKVTAETGLRPRTISGEEEAELAFLGAARGLNLGDGPRVVIDLGGGSTEVVHGLGDTIVSRVSLEIGSVRLTEAYAAGDEVSLAQLDALRAAVDAACAALSPAPEGAVAVAVAGSATTLAAMTLGLSAYDGAKVHGAGVSRDALRGWAERLRVASPAERAKLAAVSPERAPYLMAGATVLAGVLSRLGLDGLTASDGGLRYGILRAAGRL